MKYTICGKGGSGKSTVTSLMAKELAASGKRVLVIDCDESNCGLHQQLGMELPRSFTDYFGGKAAVMGMLSGGPQNMPALFDHPWTIDDIPAEYRTEKDGICLMTPGKIETANEACACPFNVVMVQFIPMLKLAENDVVIMDMEAGLEHLGRGTAANMDQFVVVIEPGARSVQTYHNVKRLAKDLGITRVRVVANKIRDDGDEEFIRSAIPAEDLLGFIHYNPDIIDADRQGKSPYDFSPAAIEEIRKIKAILDRDES